MRYGLILAAVLLLSGCVSIPSPDLPEEEGVTLRFPYATAFESVQDLLKSQGYTVALADKSAGIIETLPKRVSDEQGAVHHQVMLSFLLQGDRRSTNVYLRVIVTSDLPDERKRVLDSLRELSP